MYISVSLSFLHSFHFFVLLPPNQPETCFRRPFKFLRIWEGALDHGLSAQNFWVHLNTLFVFLFNIKIYFSILISILLFCDQYGVTPASRLVATPSATALNLEVTLFIVLAIAFRTDKGEVITPGA